MNPRLRWSCIAAVMLGCGPTLVGEAGESSSGTPAESSSTSAASADVTSSSAGVTSATTSSSTPVDTSGNPATSASPTTAVDTSTTSGGEDTEVESAGFIELPDFVGSIECSQWDQDCPPGEKCTAWANDGGNAWNATRCVPVVPDPDGVGESCTVTGSAVSGIDSCDVGAMCWDVDSETNTGVCRAFCSGSEVDPACQPDHWCTLTAEGVLTICLPTCDPLGQDCPPEQGCYGIGDTFTCAPDASGKAGEFGDPCEFINACSPGLSCLSPDSFPGCKSTSCCTEYCDITSADPCPDGFGCEAVFAPGEAPPGDENIGLCVGV